MSLLCCLKQGNPSPNIKISQGPRIYSSIAIDYSSIEISMFWHSQILHPIIPLHIPLIYHQSNWFSIIIDHWDNTSKYNWTLQTVGGCTICSWKMITCTTTYLPIHLLIIFFFKSVFVEPHLTPKLCVTIRTCSSMSSTDLY